MKWCAVGPEGQGYFWGSHGCTLGDTPHEMHECQVMIEGEVVTCCQHDGGTKVRWFSDGEWGDWREYGPGWWQ